MLLIIYLILGALAGLLAGMLGIGGGIIIVPVLIYSFKYQGINADIVAQLAVASSLAIIIFNSASAVRVHLLNRAVLWPLFSLMAMGIFIGSVAGVSIATKVSSALLEKFIAIFLIIIAVYFLLQRKVQKHRTLPDSRITMNAAGGGIGFLSTIFGIGGGVLMVPFLSWFSVDIRQAIGTSAACGLLIAMVGATANIIAGWNNSLLPTWSLGYLYLPAIAGILPASILFAMLGAKLAHNLNRNLLRMIFCFFLLLSGINLLR
jgi:uncharacterized membrane protein YfcA